MTTKLMILMLMAALGGCAKKDSSNQEGAQADQAGQAGAQPGADQAGGAQPEAGKPAAGEASAAMAEAKQIFKVRCAVCHGQTGRGNGPGAAALDPKPRDYSDMEWQKTVTDDEIKKIIVEGGQAVGKSVLMAPNPDLGQKPEVLDAMVEHIRSFGQQ